ncbi:AMP-binding protein [Streptomyces griseorubiginosus]|uniref:AMP-binding protein n=1 Tax=Streptomyces griseorubiginosus TaxID=67304 RepID=UPI0036EBA244
MLVDAIAERCTAHGDTPVLWDPCTMANLMARDFWQGVQKLAEDLRRLGVVAGTRVAVSLPVGVDLVTTIAAIWSVRASFVPLDSHEADARRHRILLSSGAALLLAKDPLSVEGTGCALAVVDCGRAAAATRSVNPDIAVHDGSEAYVMFTSGSTGLPKGIAVSHPSISSYVHAALARYRVPETGMTVLSQLPPTFDASLTTLLIPLVTCNVLRPVAETASGSASLAEGLRDVAGPVFVKTTPGQLRLVAGMLNDADLRRLRGSLILGGEPLDFADLDRFRHLADLEIYNEYGPTEATVGCSSYHVAAQDPGQGPVPIGLPFPDTSFNLVPAHLDGADVGELTVTGPGVAAGYINDPANSKFDGNWPSRSYRTGDRVRRDSAGIYHFLGRTDDQVKVNGFRVELGEVDTALRTACGGPAATVHTGSTLIGFLQRHPELNIPAAEERIAQLLPPHMRPAALHVVTEMPLTPHGKIDRKCLIEAHSDSKVPRDELTEHVASLWRRLLRTEHVTHDTDFFAEGASSVTALVMLGHASDLAGRSLPLSIIFDNPTFGGFLAAVGGAPAAPQQVSSIDSNNENHDPAAAHRIVAAPQLSIIAADGWSQGEAQYTVVCAIRLAVDDWYQLTTALARTVAQLDILHWRFGLDDDHLITAAIAPRVPIEEFDLRHRDSAAALRIISEQLHHQRNEAIDVLTGHPAARVLLWRTTGHGAAEHGVCAVVAHHTVVDEATVTLIWSRLAEQLTGHDRGADRHYAAWAAASVSDDARRHARQSADKLASELVAQPLGQLAAADAEAPAGQHSFAVPALPAAEAAQRLSLPVTAVLGGTAVAALTRFMTSPRFPVTVPVTMRRTAADFAAVGCFLNSLPVLADPSNSNPEKWLRHWNRTVLHATTHANADPAAIAAQMRTGNPRIAQLPRVAVVTDRIDVVRCGRHTWTALPGMSGPAKHDLAVYLTLPPDNETADPLRPSDDSKVTVRIEWRPGMFDAHRAATYASAFEDYLRQLTQPPAQPPAAVPQTPHLLPADPAPASANNSIAAQLAGLAASILKVEITPDTDFFAAGAQSIDLVRYCTAAQQRYGHRLDLLDVFDHPTAESQADLLLRREGPRDQPAR